MIYDIEHDGWHNARLVAHVHLTEVPSDSA